MKLLQQSGTVLAFLAVSNLLGLLASAVIARRVGPTIVGTLSIGLILLEFATIPENWTTGGHVRRAAAAPEDEVPGLLTTHLLLKLGFSFVGAGFVLLAAPTVGATVGADPHVLSLFAYVLPFSALASAIHNTFEARGNMVARGVLDTVTGLTMLGYAWVLVTTGADAVLARVAAAAATLVFAVVVYHPRLGRPVWSVARGYLSFGLRTAPGGFLRKTIWWTDTLLVAYFISTRAAGIYQVAYSVAFVLVFAGRAVSTALYPELSRGAQVGGPETFRRAYRQGFMLVVLIIGASSLLLVVLAPWLLPFLFGQAFASGIPVLQLLALSFLVDALGTPSSLALTAAGEPGLVTRVLAVMAAVNVVGNWFLVPRYGLVGAVSMTFVTFALGSGLQIALVRDRLEVLPPLSARDYRAFLAEVWADLSGLGPEGPRSP